MTSLSAKKKIPFRPELPPIGTLVVKTGSRILFEKSGSQRIDALVDDIAILHAAGIRVVLVSSGAIAYGMEAFGMTRRPSTIPLQQACASVGQNRLMDASAKSFSRHGLLIGQVLLTWDDLRSKKRYLNLRNTLFQLLDSGAVPVINENDSVGVEEIRFGTNDLLGAQMAILVQADVIVNLTDVGGLYDRNPRRDASARHIPVVPRMTEELHRLAADTKNEISVGGMGSKLKSMEMVTRAGIHALIGDGLSSRLIDVLCRPNHATLFLPTRDRLSARHRWIAFSGHPVGSLVVDGGARDAILKRGRSLLPAGIREVVGSFRSGDMVAVQDENGEAVGRGLVNYGADDLKKIKGCRSSQINGLLGKKEFDEAIHRDNLVLL